MAETQQIIFSVGSGEYGMDVSCVNAIETLDSIVSVPNAALNILGIINLRGEVLPVYSLREKFGLTEETTGEQTKIIVTQSGGVWVAFKVDSVKEIIECGEGQVSDFPSIARTEDTAYLSKILHLNGRLILLIDQDELLKEDERRAIAGLAKEATGGIA